MMTWLGEQEGDMDWLTEVYAAPPDMTCAILYGNEDAATKIEAWRAYNPHYQTPPDWTYTRDDA